VGIPALLLGLNLPALVVAARRAGRESGLAGRIYAVNTAGAVAGPLLVGFWLLPAGVGSRTGLLGGGLLLIALGIPAALARRRGLLPCALAGATGTVLALLLPRWNPALDSAGLYLYAGIRHKQKDVAQIVANREVLFYREGIHGTVAVTRERDRGDNPGLNYAMNGKVEGSTYEADMFTQVRVGEIPLALCPREPKEVFLLGLGTGISLASLLRYPLDRVDLLELSPEVIQVAEEHFRDYNNGCMNDRRVRLIREDGRTFLTLSETKYDVVISEPSNPWMAGIADLYTVETFRAMRARTREGGVVCQWVQGYLLAQERFRTVVRTWLQVFPRSLAIVSQLDTTDIFLVGLVGDRPAGEEWLIDARRVRMRLQTRSAYPFAERGGWPPRDPGDLFHSFLAGPERLRRWAGEGRLHTDHFPILAYTAPRDLYDEQATMLRWPDLPALLEPATVMVRNLTEPELAEVMSNHVHMACLAFLRDCNLAEEKLPLDLVQRAAALLDRFITSPLTRGYYFPWLVRGRIWMRGVDPAEPTVSRKWAPGCRRRRAIACFHRAASLTTLVIDPWLYLARCHRRGDDGRLRGPGSSPAEAVAAARRAWRLAPGSEEAAVLYAEILFDVKEEKQARQILGDFITAHPKKSEAARALRERLFRR